MELQRSHDALNEELKQHVLTDEVTGLLNKRCFLGKVAIVSGDPGTGKSLIATDMAIIVGWIAGAELPGGDDATDDGIADGNDGLQACGIQDAMPGAASPIDA